jgi:hypothetical protein
MSGRARECLSRRLVLAAAIAMIAGGSSAAAVAAAPGLTAGGTVPAVSAAPPAARLSGRARVGGSLQHRVDVLSKALQLDARQRSQLLTILESQRQTVNMIWSDPALLPAERTPATRALQERTANQIRDILSEEQKQRYNPPKPQGVAPPSPNVADWMERQAQGASAAVIGYQEK